MWLFYIDLRSHIFEKVSETFLSGFFMLSKVVFIKFINVIKASIKLDIEPTQRPCTICLILIRSLVVDSIVYDDLKIFFLKKYYFFIPAGKEKGTYMFMLNWLLFCFYFENGSPLKKFVMKSLPVAGYIMRGFWNLIKFLKL
jgi:hypothetical protein